MAVMSPSQRQRQQRLYGGRGPSRNDVRRAKLPPQLLRSSRSRQRGPNYALLAILGALLCLSMLTPMVALAGGGMYYFQISEQLAPRLDNLQTYQPFQTSRILDRNGNLLYEYVTEGRRESVPLADVSPLLIDATVAIEDKNFWTNAGVDYVGIARSAYLNIQADETLSGASTITQQYIKLVLLTPEERLERISRKIKEAILARQLTQAYSKEKILELYLNEVNYGDRNYGIQAAARGFFGVDADALDLNQASLLAGLPQLPTIHNPRQFTDAGVLRGVELKPGWLNPNRPLPNGTTRVRVRQIEVLRQMVLNGMVTEREARAAVAEDLRIAEPSNIKLAPHFVDHVVEQLEADPEIGPILMNQGGLTITTTVDLRFQDLAQRVARRNIEELLAEDRNIHNAAVVIQQPGTGHILAMLGSIDYDASKPTTTPGQTGNVLDGQVNVTTRERQPGSALKPFVYLSALHYGTATPGSIFLDQETRFPIRLGASDANINSCIPEGEYWYCPRNYDLKWHGPIRMREALATSLNIPALLAIHEIGVPQTINVLHAAGITGLQRDDYGLAVALGGGEVKLLDLTTAYTTLANDGRYIEPTAILKITDRNDVVLREPQPQPRQVVDPRHVALIRDYMSDNDARTPMFGAESALKLSRPAAVKTGTTNDYRDAWTMGFTPYVTVGVWGGNNNNERMNQIGGVGAGGRIWNQIMEGIFADPALDSFLRGSDLHAPVEFPPLESYGLVERPMCLLGGRFAPRSSEWFVPDMPEPKLNHSECLTQDVIQPAPEAGVRMAAYGPLPAPITTEQDN